MSAEEALKLLKEGNGRYVAGSQKHPNQDFKQRDLTTKKGQHPFATVLSCSDSRVPVEILFDKGVGEVFVVRVAGNVAGPSETASIEYAVEHLGTPLLVVLGHTRCGAVTAVCQNADVHGHVATLVKNIIPAVEKAKAANPKASGDVLVKDSIEANVQQAIEDIFRTSPVVADQVRAGKLQVVGAIYEIDTGTVRWKGAHPKQDQLLAKPKAH